HAHLARPRDRAAADQSCIRDGVMGCTEWAPGCEAAKIIIEFYGTKPIERSSGEIRDQSFVLPRFLSDIYEKWLEPVVNYGPGCTTIERKQLLRHLLRGNDGQERDSAPRRARRSKKQVDSRRRMTPYSKPVRYGRGLWRN